MIQVIRALCDKEVYTRLSRIPLDAFEKEPRAIVRALGEAHEKFEHDISPADLKVYFHSKNPGLTKSQRDAYDLLLAKLRDVEPMSPEMVEDVLRDMTRVALGRQIGESGFALMEGHTTSIDTLRALLDMYDAGMAGETSPMVAEDLDPEALLSTLNHEERWAFNLSSLKERVPGLSPGHFLLKGCKKLGLLCPGFIALTIMGGAQIGLVGFRLCKDLGLLSGGSVPETLQLSSGIFKLQCERLMFNLVLLLHIY